MDAIASELVPMPLAAITEHETSAPEIFVRESVAGRETLAAILEEARPDGRAPLNTLRYGDRVSNAPGAKTPSTAPLATPAAAVATPAAAVAAAGVEIFEMMTYVVRGADASRLSSEVLRRSFVEEHLLPSLPTASMDDVDRVDVTPWTVQGTLVVRVWCRLRRGRKSKPPKASNR